VRRIIEVSVLVLLCAGIARGDEWRFYVKYARVGQSATSTYAPPEHLYGLPPTIHHTLAAAGVEKFRLGQYLHPNAMPSGAADELHAVAQAYVLEHADRYPRYDPAGGVALVWAMRVAAGSGATTTTTTAPGASSTTTTVISSATTTTTLPGSLQPVRFSFGDVGRHYPDSQEINWRVDNGERANQYYAWTRIRTLHFIVEPRVFRLMRDIPSCSSPSIMKRISTIPGVDVSKFIFNYVLRPVRSGQPYTVHPNYLWDIPQNWLDVFAKCLLADPVANAANPLVTLDVLQLTNLRVEDGRLVEGDLTYCDPSVHACTRKGGVAHARKSKTAGLRQGRVDPRVKNKPLTDAQCAALMAMHHAHQAHGQALLARERMCESGPREGQACILAADCGAPCVDAAPILAREVVARQLAFESLARNPHEQTLFSLIFIGDIDPKRDPAETDVLTQKTLDAHERWMAGFHCDTHEPPDTVAIVEGELEHARAHWLRALDLDGVCLKTICDRFINYCPCEPL
jgi:hypothetical protein